MQMGPNLSVYSTYCPRLLRHSLDQRIHVSKTPSKDPRQCPSKSHQRPEKGHLLRETFAAKLSPEMSKQEVVTRSETSAVRRVGHPEQPTFVGTFSYLCCIGYWCVIEMGGHLALGHRRSVWIATCRGRKEDFLGMLSAIHVLTLGQNIHEECPDAVKEHRERPPWLAMRESLRFFDFFPGRHPFCGEMVGIEQPRLLSIGIGTTFRGASPGSVPLSLQISYG
jgi:hypothetical protein